MTEVAVVVSAYWGHYRLTTGDRAERLRAESGDHDWAWDVVENAARDGRPDVLALFDALLAAADADPCYLGAGPLEELLIHHGAAFDQAVADRCRRSDVWRAALSCVWIGEDEARALVTLQPLLAKPSDHE